MCFLNFKMCDYMITPRKVRYCTVTEHKEDIEGLSCGSFKITICVGLRMYVDYVYTLCVYHAVLFQFHFFAPCSIIFSRFLLLLLRLLECDDPVFPCVHARLAEGQHRHRRIKLKVQLALLPTCRAEKQVSAIKKGPFHQM